LTSNLANAIENAANCSAGRECTLRRELIHNSISKRIGKGQTKLKQISAGFFQCKYKIDSAL